MILHLPQLLIPHRLATVTSIEMRWRLSPYETSFDEFHNLLAITQSAFPHLKELHLSLEGRLLPTRSPGFSYIEQCDADILVPVDGLVRRLRSLKICEVALPLSLYDLKKLKAKGKYVKHGYRKNSERLWRDLPNVKEDTEIDVAHLLGYWVCLI